MGMCFLIRDDGDAALHRAECEDEGKSGREAVMVLVFGEEEDPAF
jgi:hypothetical protein